MGEMVTATITLKQGMELEGTAGSGHTLTMDTSGEFGGENRGFRPMELILVGLGGCTAFDVLSILRKMRQPVTGYEIHLSGERACDHPKVYQKIRIEHVIRGRGIKEQTVKKAIDLSLKTYCSAAAMLARTASIETSFQIVEG